MRQVYRRRGHGRVLPQRKLEVPYSKYGTHQPCMEDDRVEVTRQSMRPKTCKGRHKVTQAESFLFAQKHPTSLMRPGTAPLKRTSFKHTPQRGLDLDVYLRKLHSTTSSAAVKPTKEKPSRPQANVYLLRDGQRPVGVNGLEKHRVVQCLSTEEEHFLVMRDGTVYTVSATVEPCLAKPRLVQFALKVKIETLACGSDHVAAIVRDNSISRVFGWGSNTCGELGQRDGKRRDQGVFVSQFDDKFAWSVACGKNSTLVLNKIGQVWGLGSSKSGVLGHGCYEVCPNPVRMVLKRRATALACGDTHSVVLLEDGSIVESGRYIGETEVFCVPREVRGMCKDGDAQPLFLSANATSSCAVFDDGSVHIWGNIVKERQTGGSSSCALSFFSQNKINCRGVCISTEEIAVTSQTGNIYVANLKSNQESDPSFRVVEYFAKAHIRVNSISCCKSTICAVRGEARRNPVLRLPASPGRDIGCFALLDQPPVVVTAGKPARVRFTRANCSVTLQANVHGDEAPLVLRFKHCSASQTASVLTIESNDASFQEQMIVTVEGKVASSAFQPLKRSFPVTVRALVTKMSWRTSGQGLSQFIPNARNTFVVELQPQLQQFRSISSMPQVVISNGIECVARQLESGRSSYSYFVTDRGEELTISVLFQGNHIPGSPFKVKPVTASICGQNSRVFLDNSRNVVLELKSKMNARIAHVCKEQLRIQCFGRDDELLLGAVASLTLEQVEEGLYRFRGLSKGVHKVSINTIQGNETISGSPCSLTTCITMQFSATTVIEGGETTFRCSPPVTTDITAIIQGKTTNVRIIAGKGTLAIGRLVENRRPCQLPIVFKSRKYGVKPRESRLRVIPLEVALVRNVTALTTSHRISDGFYYESELCCLVLDSFRSSTLHDYVLFVKELTATMVADNELKLKLIKTIAYEAAAKCFPFMEQQQLQAILCKYLCDKCAVRCALNPMNNNSYQVVLNAIKPTSDCRRSQAEL